jgi:hypothetical protein
MADKKTIGPGDTFVFDDAEIEALDKMSLTGVLRDVTGAVKQIDEESEEADEKDDGLDSLDLGYLVPED